MASNTEDNLEYLSLESLIKSRLGEDTHKANKEKINKQTNIGTKRRKPIKKTTPSRPRATPSAPKAAPPPPPPPSLPPPPPPIAPKPKKYTPSPETLALEKRRKILLQNKKIDENFPADIFYFVSEQPKDQYGVPTPKEPTSEQLHIYRQLLADARNAERIQFTAGKLVWIEFDFSNRRQFRFKVQTGDSVSLTHETHAHAHSACCMPFVADKDIEVVHARVYVDAVPQSSWHRGKGIWFDTHIEAPSFTNNVVIMVWFGTPLATDLRHDACAVFPVLEASSTSPLIQAFNPSVVRPDYNFQDKDRFLFDDKCKSWCTLDLINWIADVPAIASALASNYLSYIPTGKEVYTRSVGNETQMVIRKPKGGVYAPFAEICRYAMVTESLAKLDVVNLHMESSSVLVPGMVRWVHKLDGTGIMDSAHALTCKERKALVGMIFQKLYALSRVGVMYSDVTEDCFFRRSSDGGWVIRRLDRLCMIQISVGNKTPPMLLAQRSMMSALNLAAMIMGCKRMKEKDIEDINVAAFEKVLKEINNLGALKFEKVEVIVALLKIAENVFEGGNDMWRYAYETVARWFQYRAVECDAASNPLGLEMQELKEGSFRVPEIFFPSNEE